MRYRTLGETGLLVHDEELSENEAEMLMSERDDFVVCAKCKRDQLGCDWHDPDPRCLGCNRQFVYRPWWEW